MSTPALDALDRARTVVVLTVSPLEEHGPHLPVGVDAFAARHFAEKLGERLTAGRPGWTSLAGADPHLGSFTFDAAGTVSVRQRVVRDAARRLRALDGAGRLPLHPGRQRSRRTRTPDGARGGRRDRLAATPRDDGVVLRPPRLAVPPRPVPREDRGGARAPAVRRRAAGVRRGRPRRLVGDLPHAAPASRPRRPVVSRAAAGPLLARRARRAELSAPQRRPGLRGPSRAGGSGVRQGGDRGAHDRDDGAGGRAPRGTISAARRPLAVLRPAVLPDRLLAGRPRGHRGPRDRRRNVATLTAFGRKGTVAAAPIVELEPARRRRLAAPQPAGGPQRAQPCADGRARGDARARRGHGRGARAGSRRPRTRLLCRQRHQGDADRHGRRRRGARAAPRGDPDGPIRGAGAGDDRRRRRVCPGRRADARDCPGPSCRLRPGALRPSRGHPRLQSGVRDRSPARRRGRRPCPRPAPHRPHHPRDRGAAHGTRQPRRRAADPRGHRRSRLRRTSPGRRAAASRRPRRSWRRSARARAGREAEGYGAALRTSAAARERIREFADRKKR